VDHGEFVALAACFLKALQISRKELGTYAVHDEQHSCTYRDEFQFQ
jgi:hypothetical protein